MLPEYNWDRIQELFLIAADLPAPERAGFLDQACHGDARLRREVESLLRADSSGGSAVYAAIESEAVSLLEGASLAGARLGAYRMVREIGRGGMGAVYLAERDDEQYRKQVAIKVVKRGMDTQEVLDRFRHERQILAGLEHPYIARLIDGGTTPDGCPFFVLEWVDGHHIDRYCRERNLDLESRLQLFLRVCEAVSYAHRGLVVHRDLKPSNILVTAEGVPKLLDFGVAKLLGPGADPGLTATAVPMGPLTPEYASPEQIRGLPITTAADVYALGAVLFELLTETRAQKMTTHTPSEIERVVCQTETLSPSAVARAAGRPKLNDDLDNIVLMAMRKEPERRYQSVDQLAEDLRRYLDGRPVQARQDSFGYRSRKYFRRHRLPIAAAALVLLSIVGGAALAVMQAREAQVARRMAEAQKQTAERERARAEAEKQIAERERARAELEALAAKTEQDRSERRLTEMVGLADRSLYQVHSAIEKLPGATQARREIVATTLEFLQDLYKDAGQDDRLRFVLSVSYLKVANVLGYPTVPNLGDSKGALANYQKSIALIEPLLAKEPNRPDYILQWLEAHINTAAVLERTEGWQRSAALLQSILPRAKKLTRLCPKDSRCLLAEGGVYSHLLESVSNNDSDAASDYARLQTESYERALKVFPDNPKVQRELAQAYSQQAKIHNRRGELTEAAERYRRAVTLWERALERNPSDVLTRRSLMITSGNLGGNLGGPFYRNMGDTAGAREYYGKALAIARDLARADSNDQLAQYDLANALMFYSTLDLPKEEWPASVMLLREADGILQRLVAADPQSFAKLRPLAMVQEYEGRRLEGLGNRDEAIIHYRRSVATSEKALSRSPSDLTLIAQILASQEVLAESLAHQGDGPGALELARKSVARAEQVSASPSERDRAASFVAGAYKNLATVQAALGNWSEAHTAAEKAVAGYRQLAAAGARRINPAEAARAESLLQDCLAHLK